MKKENVITFTKEKPEHRSGSGVEGIYLDSRFLRRRSIRQEKDSGKVDAIAFDTGIVKKELLGGVEAEALEVPCAGRRHGTIALVTGRKDNHADLHE